MSRNNTISRTDIYSLKLILILPSHLHQGLPKGLFPVGLPVETFKELLPSSIWLHNLLTSIFKI